MVTPIINGNPPDADAFMNSYGSNLNDIAQMIFNADYIGFNTRLNNTGAPKLNKSFFSTFKADNADAVQGFVYDATNDLYETPDLSTGLTEYVIIEADDDTISWTNNDTRLMKISSGKWLLYGTAGTDAVKRSQIHKSLWYGTDGTDQLILDFTNVTAVKTSHTNDVDKKAYFARTAADIPSSFGNYSSSLAITFNDTVNNTNFSSWSDLTIGTSNFNAIISCRWQVPSGNSLNNITTVSPSGSISSLEIGTDLSADETDNPATANLLAQSGLDGQDDAALGTSTVIFIYEGTITVIPSFDGTPTTTQIVFNVDNSIPAMSAAGSLSSEGLLISTLIFKDTASETVTNAIPIINSTIDVTSSEQISLSSDGSNFTNVNNTEIVRPSPNGTDLQRKIVITRTDLSKLDIVTEQLVKYNYY